MAFSCGHHTQEQTKWTLPPKTQFCPNLACPARKGRGKTGEKNIIVHSRKPERYKCTVCGKTFSAKVGTPFYRLHHSSADLVMIVMILGWLWLSRASHRRRLWSG